MGINWDEIHIRAGALSNEIYVGKMKNYGGIDVFKDKSTPKTKECVKAVMEHMLGQCKKGENEEITFTVDGICKLTLTDLRTNKI